MASSTIHCTSRQSRFHLETLHTSREIDLNDVSISVGPFAHPFELLTNAHLRIKEGVRYGLVGRNGSGKSTLLKAIADRLIPGLNPKIRVLLLDQIEDGKRALEDKGKGMSVLEHVVRGDKARQKALESYELLKAAIESPSPTETQRLVYTHLLHVAELHLLDAQKTARLRSGTRGKEARGEELAAEENLRVAQTRLNEVGQRDVEDDIVAQALALQEEVQAELDLYESDSATSRAASILAGLGFSEAMISAPYSSLSGGWRSRCSLATSLLVKSDVLLLDEPSNFLDLEAVVWLEQFLTSEETRTLVLISHDADLLENVVEETIILRNKTLKYFEGTPAAFEAHERKEIRHKIKVQEALDKKKSHARRNFLGWRSFRNDSSLTFGFCFVFFPATQVEKSIAQGAAAAKKSGDENRQRMVKSRQKKLDDRWGVETSAKGTRFKLNRDMVGFFLTSRAGVEFEELEPKIKIHLQDPDQLRTAGDLIHFDDVEFHWPKTDKPILEGVTFTLHPGGRIAFVGANGQGKSTLAKLIMGEIKPTKGKITLHPLIKIGYFAQHSVEELSISNEVGKDGAGMRKKGEVATALSYFLDKFEKEGEIVPEQEAYRILGSFGLQGKIASETPLTHLSGGQKVRLAFALLVYHPPHLLLLDEISTHVDQATLRSLASALKHWSGAIILITHDRSFSRAVIEGGEMRIKVEGEEDDEDDGDSSEEEDGETGGRGREGEARKERKRGRTWRVGGGKLREMVGGMEEYVGWVERKAERRRKREEQTKS